MKHKVIINIEDDEETGLFTCATHYDPPFKYEKDLSRAQYLGDFVQRNAEAILDKGKSKYGKNWYPPEKNAPKYGKYKFADSKKTDVNKTTKVVPVKSRKK